MGGRPNTTPFSFAAAIPSRLAGANEFPLSLRHIAENLEDEVRNKHTGPVSVLPGVQQGHIQHNNIAAALSGDETPLLLDFIIISAKPVDAFYKKRVARLELFYQLLVSRAIEVLSGKPVREDHFLRDARLPQGREERSISVTG